MPGHVKSSVPSQVLVHCAHGRGRSTTTLCACWEHGHRIFFMVLSIQLYSILGLYWDNENKMETAIVYWGNIGTMEKKMETAIVYWGNIGIMEKKMETTIYYKP